MGFDTEILTRVLNTRRTRTVRREAAAAARRDEIFAKYPDIADIDASARVAVIEAAKSIITERTDDHALNRAREKADTAALVVREMLKKAGYPPDALDIGADCEMCRDSGYLPSGEPCKCLRSDYKVAQLDELIQTLPLQNATFDNFTTDIFTGAYDADWGISPRENIEGVRDICREFADGNGGNILLCGAPGTGKTYLASCVAHRANDNARSVLYRTAAEIVAVYERAKFTYDDDVHEIADGEIERLKRCDLLIIDDLGGEFKTPFVNTALLSLLSERLRKHRAMFVCTGLDEEKELATRYTPQIASRLRGDFDVLPLFGGDLRVK